MFRLALKGALARKLRLALTAVSIILGVAFVSGTYVLTDTLNATFERIFGNAESGVSVVVRGTQAFTPGDSGGNGDERALVPDSVLQTVRHVQGVSSALGVASGFAQLVYQGKAVTNGGAPNLGTAWAGNDPANPVHVVQGRPPAADGEVIIDEHSAGSSTSGWARTRMLSWKAAPSRSPSSASPSSARTRRSPARR